MSEAIMQDTNTEVKKIYQIKNWDNFQHFKQRTPPWIKLYRGILDDPEWHELPGDAAKTLIMLWLIASENKIDEQDGRLPDISRLAFRLRVTENRLIAQLEALKHYVYHHDNIVMSPCNQDATPETDAEKRQIREKKEKENARRRAVPPAIADVVEYCKERGNGVDPQQWHDFYSSKNWMIGKNRMKDWQAAVRTWERGRNQNKTLVQHYAGDPAAAEALRRTTERAEKHGF